eukprot:SAG22_NODE_3_length_48349_cov_158.681180_32_plen_126_part_00
MEIAFADGDGGSCRVKQSVLGKEAVPAALGAMYSRFIEWRPCAFGWGSGGKVHAPPGHSPRVRGAPSQTAVARLAVATDPSSGEQVGYMIYFLGGSFNSPGQVYGSMTRAFARTAATTAVRSVGL